jgi:hypothetical protein
MVVLRGISTVITPPAWKGRRRVGRRERRAASAGSERCAAAGVPTPGKSPRRAALVPPRRAAGCACALARQKAEGGRAAPLTVSRPRDRGVTSSSSRSCTFSPPSPVRMAAWRGEGGARGGGGRGGRGGRWPTRRRQRWRRPRRHWSWSGAAHADKRIKGARARAQPRSLAPAHAPSSARLRREPHRRCIGGALHHERPSQPHVRPLAPLPLWMTRGRRSALRAPPPPTLAPTCTAAP